MKSIVAANSGENPHEKYAFEKTAFDEKASITLAFSSRYALTNRPRVSLVDISIDGQNYGLATGAEAGTALAWVNRRFLCGNT